MIFKRLTLLVFIFCFSVHAKETYTIGVEGIEFLPYSSAKNGEYTGALREIMDEFAKAEGIEFTYQPLPIKRLYTNFFSGKIDFKLPASKYWQKEIKEKRKLNIIYSEDIIKYIDGVMVTKSEQGIEKLKKLGIIAGFTPWGYQEQIKKGDIQLFENTKMESIIHQLMMKRIDGFYTNIAVTNKYLNENFEKNNLVKYDKTLPNTTDYYKIATLKHGEIIEKFNKFLTSKRDEIKKIEKKYGLHK